MNAKTWEEMDPAEKIEDLRKDVKRLFDAVNSLNRRAELMANQTTTNLEKLAAMIDDINDRLKKAGVA